MNIGLTLHARQRLEERAPDCAIEELIRTMRPAISMDFSIFGAARVDGCKYYVAWSGKTPFMLVFSSTDSLVTIVKQRTFRQRW